MSSGSIESGRFTASARLALIQAVIVVVAFALAGYLAQLAIERLDQRAIRNHVRGEVASLHDEVVQKGIDHLPYTVAKRTRLWRGFDYRIVGRDCVLKAGRLPRATPGWSHLSVLLEGPARPPHRFLVFTETLSNGSTLSVGQDLVIAAGQTAAIRRILLLCGALGVMFCLGASYLLTRNAWRRIALVSGTARQVSAGRLDVRVPVRAARAKDDIDELGLAFNGMLDRIGALIVQLRQVTNDIAHDLRTPLTRVRHKLERLRADLDAQPTLVGQVAALDDDVVEILRTFDALLQLAEIGSRAGRAGELVDLAEAANRVAEAFRLDIEDSGRFLDVACEQALVAGDGALLAQVCANLLENALRHTPTGTRIMLRVQRAGAEVLLVVADDGPGVPAEEREEALKPFVRLERSRTTKGSGIGLSIVAAIAAQHGVRLKLEDASPGLRVSLAFDAPELGRGGGRSACAADGRAAPDGVARPADSAAEDQQRKGPGPRSRTPASLGRGIELG